MCASEVPKTGLQLQSTIKASGELELSLAEVEVPAPKADEVVVRVEASPINPSDMGLLFGPADMSTALADGTAERPVIRAQVPEKLLRTVAARIDQSMPVGNEGAGVVVATGSDESARALQGKVVAVLGGAMYAQYRVQQAKRCLVLPPGTTPAQGASCFVNPLTALGMVGTMRLEGHRALVHTAAASNLGQMLQRICLADRVPLVNCVRRQEQVDLLRSQGAEHVCNSASPDFMDELTQALVATGATIAFDATGGGRLASQILTCMEAALSQTATEFSRYGTTVHKQVYIYGSLDRTPTELTRNYGAAWGVGGWLLTAFLQRIGFEAAQKLRERVAAEITTTFASHYTQEVSLREALSLDAVSAYRRQATGQKFLICPQRGLA